MRSIKPILFNNFNRVKFIDIVELWTIVSSTEGDVLYETNVFNPKVFRVLVLVIVNAGIPLNSYSRLINVASQ